MNSIFIFTLLSKVVRFLKSIVLNCYVCFLRRSLNQSYEVELKKSDSVDFPTPGRPIGTKTNLLIPASWPYEMCLNK